MSRTAIAHIDGYITLYLYTITQVEDRDRQLTVAHNRILGLESRLRDSDTKYREAGMYSRIEKESTRKV